MFGGYGGRVGPHVQVLTKRPPRMRSLLCSNEFRSLVCRHWTELGSGGESPAEQWPLPNVWLGVSVETQKWAGSAARLAATPAAVRFASYEPLLRPRDLRPWLGPGLDWVIAGGESGAGYPPWTWAGCGHYATSASRRT